MDNIDALKSDLTVSIADAVDVDALEQIRISALGKKEGPRCDGA